MTNSGDFSAEAYDQLRQAYADNLTTQDEQELAGHELLGQKMTLETLPVNSPWRNRIDDWQYPNGKSQYMDGKQTPEEILEVMRQSVMDSQAEDEEAELTDEELEGVLNDILGEEEESDDLDDDLIAEDAEEEEDEDEDEEDEEDEEEVGEADEAEEAYEVEEEEVEDDESIDPEEVADQIAALREQIEAFRFTTEDTEEPDDDES
jgi:hypothetical protein